MQTLGKYGNGYQAKVITCLLTDIEFSSRIYDVLSPKYFDSEAMSWLVETILDYFGEYHTLATIDVIHYQIESIQDSVFKTEVILALESVVNEIESTDLEFVKERIISFCREEELKLAIYESVDLANSGRLDEVKTRIDSALKKGEDRSIGHDYLTEVKARYSVLARKPISTGWPYIDRIMQGGLSPGELGVVVGPGGSGKSWVLTTLCMNAVRAGRSVVLITLELNDTYVAVRHDTVLTGIPTEELPNKLDVLHDELQNLKGNLTIKWYPTKSLSIIGLRSYLDRLRLLGQLPELLIIDYADLMKLNSDRGKRKDEVLQDLYEELRGLSGEYQIPIWTASQTTRESNREDAEFIGAEMIAESMGKHYTADFMMSIDRRGRRKTTNTAQFHIIKNRFGVDGITLYAKMDTRIGVVEIYRPGSKEHKETKRLIASDFVGMKTKMRDLMDNDTG